MLWAAILTLCVPTLKDRMYVDVFEASEEMGETAQVRINDPLYDVTVISAVFSTHLSIFRTMLYLDVP